MKIIQKTSEKLENKVQFNAIYVFIFCVLSILSISFNMSYAIETNYLSKFGLKVITSNENELVVSYKPKLIEVLQEHKEGQYSQNISTENKITFLSPIISGAVSLSNTHSAPNNIGIKADITLPAVDGCKITNIQVGRINQIDGYLIPFETGYYKSTIDIINEKNVNLESHYSQFETPNWANIKYNGVARNRYVGNLELVAARYNSETNKIEIPSEIIVRIEFTKPVNFNYSNNKVNNQNVNELLNNFTTLNENVASKFISYRVFDSKLEKSIYDFANNYNSSSNNKNNKTQNDEKLSSGNWFKIEIPQTGFYRITLQQLQELGFNPNVDNINSVKVFGNGGKNLDENQNAALLNNLNEQELIEEKNGNNLSSFVFFAEGTIGFRVETNHKFDIRNNQSNIRHYINPFAKTSSYLLTWGGKSGKRASNFAENGTPINFPKTYTHRIVTNEETTMVFPEGSGRLFFGRSNLNEPFRNLLHNLDRDGSIMYRCQVANKDVSTSFFTFSENGNVLTSNRAVNGQGNNDYNHAHYFEFEFSGAARNVANDNRSALKIDMSNNNKTALGFFDYLEIHYPRSLVAIDNEIEIFTDNNINGLTQYNISGFANTTKYAVDVTDIKSPIVLKNLANDGDKFIFNTELNSSYRRYYISTKTSSPKISKINFANLREDYANSDVILITHKDFIGSALELKKYRESVSDLKVTIFDVEDIMNEFGSGMLDPTAIRDFIAFAYANWEIKPSYVIMWGKGHFDYRNITTKTPSFVPVFEIDAPFDFTRGQAPVIDEINSSCFDDYFVRIVGNDKLIDLAIGRVPIDEPKVGFDFVNKIKHYENNSANDNWRTSTTMLGDDGPTTKGNDGNTHIRDIEELINGFVNPDFYNNKVYLPDFPTVFLSNTARARRKPAVTPFLLNKLNNDGSLIFNFVGHGNPKLMTHEQVLERERDIPLMTNYDKLFFLTAATCDYAKFDNPSFRDGTSEMLFSTKGGAIGALAASRVVYSSANAELNERFYRILYSKNSDGSYKTIGEIGYLLKQEMFDTNSEKYFIFGDPTMKLLMPKYNVKVTHLNDENIEDNKNQNVKALTSYKFRGNIYQNDGKTVANDFNGSVTLTIYDTDNNVTIRDEASTYFYKRYGGLLSRTKAEVSNGSFEIEFVLPKDVNFEDDFIRINFFAANNKNEHALGGFNSIKVDGVDTSIIDDKTGPEITAYMNNKNFINGGLVGTDAILYVDLFDPIGINSTGNGIGRKIEAWIDNSPNSIDLTSNYKTDEFNYRNGFTNTLLKGLTPGIHHAKIRAWDLFNNYSYAEINFEVKPEIDGLIIKNTINYPNPFNESTRVSFTHNASLPADVIINIYDVLGEKLKTIVSNQSFNPNFEFIWDATDNNGKLVPNGHYYYTITIKNSNIGEITGAGSMMIYMKE